MSSMDFDVIVVGSGITGGWVAKEMTERGFKVLMIERGRMVAHQIDYKTETAAPWDLKFHGMGDRARYARDFPVQSKKRFFTEWTETFWVNDRENPFQSVGATPFTWHRGYQLGGRSLLWGRQCYRWGDVDFAANGRDGHGNDWPIRYRDVAPWYDHVEDFIGVSGQAEHLDQLPDGRFQPPMQLNPVERHLKQSIEDRYPTRRLTIGRTSNLTEAKGERAPCQNRNICDRGCSFGAYFSTQSSTLPAAQATGRLTLVTDSLVEGVDYDPKTKRATGVRVLNTANGARKTYTSRVVFLNAGSFNTVGLMLRSASEAMPAGLANSSGTLGRYIMDHGTSMAAAAIMPGFEAHTYFGNRPTGIVIPRFRNVTEPTGEFLRGYSFQGGTFRQGWKRGVRQAGIGAGFKAGLRPPGQWVAALITFAECLPQAENRITLDPVKVDAYGAPQLNINFAFGDNESRLLADASQEARTMLEGAGGRVIAYSADPEPAGSAIHEMGGARMGRDPRSSVVNGFNQAHDIGNLFLTDGAVMNSTASQNPSLTYMALTARACDHAATLMKAGAI